MYNKTRGIGYYQKNTAHSKSVCEQVAFLFDHLAKLISDSEKAFHDKDYAKGADLSAKSIEMATGLCSILMPDNDQQAHRMDASGQSWQIYFMDLIQTIGRINMSHNPVLLEKTVSSLKDMGGVWRTQSKTENQHKLGIAPHAAPQNHTSSLNVDV